MSCLDNTSKQDIILSFYREALQLTYGGFVVEYAVHRILGSV